MEQVFATASKLSEVILEMQKCLQCTICLCTISEPVKTRCGHRFCHKCIQKVVESKNACCPLCNTNLPRRSISKDEAMELYIDKLEKLKEAIQMDSGIDTFQTTAARSNSIVHPAYPQNKFSRPNYRHVQQCNMRVPVSLGTSKPRSTRESCSSDGTEYNKSDKDETIGPSCSRVDATPSRKLRGPKSKRGTQTHKKVSTRGKSKRESVSGSDITRYLNKHALSGIELLPPDESSCQGDNSMESKVECWLKTLPKDEPLEDPNKTAPMEPSAFNLDETTAFSVSQTYENVTRDRNQASTSKAYRRSDNDGAPARRSAGKRLSAGSLRAENQQTEMIEVTRGSSQAGSRLSKSKDRQVDLDAKNQRPGASSAMKSADHNERTTEVLRTSPCNMLPTMKQSWSSVAKFGKELRAKRKKRSLNVSVENTRTRRSLSEIEKEEVESEAIKAIGDKERENRANPSESNANDRVEKTLPNVRSDKEQILERNIEKTPAKGKRDRSLPERTPAKLSFEEQLSNSQMKDIDAIIGVSRTNEVEILLDNDERSEEALPLKKRNLSYRTPTRDRFKSSVEATPTKRASAGSSGKANAKSNSSSPDLLCGSGFLLGEELIEQTPNRSRLSLKRVTDPKANESPKFNDASITVKRDLNREMDLDSKDSADEDRTRLTFDVKAKSDEGNRQERKGFLDQRSVDSRCSTSSNENRGNKEGERSKRFVAFKKLGKVFKHRKKPTTFLYLGSTRPKPSRSRGYSVVRQEISDTPEVQVLSTSKFISGNRFGNGTLVTVNDTPQVEKTSATTDLREKPEVLEVPKDTSKSVQPGALTDAVGSTQRINVYNNAPKASTSASSESQFPESNDVLFVSIDDEDKSSYPKPPVPTTTAPKNPVKLLSPEKDSQLKFLTFTPSSADSLRVAQTKYKSDATKDTKPKKSISVKGAHSRALIRRSQQALETSKIDSPSTPDRKRKRSANRDQLEATKRKSMNPVQDSDSSSSKSFSSQTTYKVSTEDIAAKKKNPSAKSTAIPSSSARNVETVLLLSSDSDTDYKGTKGKEENRIFRRILPLASSDTDSPEFGCLNAVDDANDQVAASPASKRKRAPSPDSECDAEVDVIVRNWSSDVNPDRSAKKGKVEQTRDPYALPSSDEIQDSLKSRSSMEIPKAAYRVSHLQYRQPSVNNIRSSSERSSFGAEKQGAPLNKDGFESNDSPDFGSIVDRIRDLQKSLTDNKDFNEQDNFDEAMANVDTDALIDEYSESKQHGKSSFLRSSIKDAATPHKFSGSDKENKYKDFDQLCESFTDSDKTLIPEYANVDRSSKRISLQPDESQGRARQPDGRKNAWDALANNPMSCDNDEANGDVDGNTTSKETCYEQDSLMDITQHYLQIKQFEEDLFGKPASSNGGVDRKKENDVERTPRKGGEHSAEEDDIVENTPEVKAKSVQATSSSTKGSSLTSSLSRKEARQFKTPSSVAERSSSDATPLCKRRIPLYESTPKPQITPKNNIEQKLCNKEPKPATSTFNDKYTRNVSRNNTQSARKQRLCFVCSGLEPSRIELVRRLASMVNARYVTQFNPDVTHVIVKTNKENNGANKTLKYLQGIAHRKWIVGDQWVVDSLNEKKLMNEERYEAVDNGTLEAGPRKSRLREKDLFEGFVFLCIGPYSDVSVEQYQELLRATGATVVRSLDDLAAEKRKLKVIVIQADVYSYEIIGWYKKARAVPVVHDWVVECISQYKLISLYPYLQELSRQDVLALGYPEFLVEDDPDMQSDAEDESTHDTTT